MATLMAARNIETAQLRMAIMMRRDNGWMMRLHGLSLELTKQTPWFYQKHIQTIIPMQELIDVVIETKVAAKHLEPMIDSNNICFGKQQSGQRSCLSRWVYGYSGLCFSRCGLLMYFVNSVPLQTYSTTSVAESSYKRTQLYRLAGQLGRRTENKF